MTVYINSSETNPKSFVVPGSAISNGAGANSSLPLINPPVFEAYNVGGGTSSQIGSAGLSYSASTSFGTFSLGGGLDIFGALLMTFKF